MGEPARLPLLLPVVAPPSLLRAPEREEVPFNFHSLALAEPPSVARGRGVGLAIAVVAHAVLVVAAVLLPLVMFEDVLPSADHAVRAFFTSPPDVAPPPPPPPPPPAAAARPKL